MKVGMTMGLAAFDGSTTQVGSCAWLRAVASMCPTYGVYSAVYGSAAFSWLMLVWVDSVK